MFREQSQGKYQGQPTYLKDFKQLFIYFNLI